MERNTKEWILDAAFSFYHEPLFVNVSLSQIAQRTGISKAAIFKHFKNKETLIQAMDNRLYDSVSLALEQMQGLHHDGKDIEALKSIIVFLIHHREYVFYLVCTKASLTEDAVLRELHRRGMPFLEMLYDENGSIKDMELYFRSIFVSATILIFVMWLFKDTDNEELLGYEPEDFIHSLNGLIENGMGNRSQPIADERLAELDALCRITGGEIEAEDKIFLAISRIASKSGFQDITVEKIADELGLAKSSLYSSYTNKTDLIRCSILGELQKLYAIIIRKLKAVQQSDERLYVLFQAELAYFMLRPQILFIFQALFADASLYDDKIGQGITDRRAFCAQMQKLKLLERIPDMGVPFMDELLIFSWLSVLPGVVYIHCQRNDFSPDFMRTAMRSIYHMVEFGISGKEVH